MLQAVTWAIFVLVTTGIASWAMRRRAGTAGLVGAAGCVIAGILGTYGAGACLVLHRFEARRAAWNAPYASMALGLDSLTALFLLPLFFVGAMIAISALRRLPGDYAANRPHEHWLYLNCTLASAGVALVARNAVLFLFAWEAMTVASFLLVENDGRDPAARGGWTYLTAGHIGGACLLALFALMGRGGNMDFNALTATGPAMPAAFLLAFAGFGGKIGLAPLHAPYPESYPVSPAHVGALLSGVVGNMGIYGLLRFLLLAAPGGPPPAWWGYLLLFSGLGSGIIGAVRSLASRDLARLLAWSSVEHYGLMATGIGLGLLGASSGYGVIACLGFAAAIFHMLNHSLSKSLLFLSAGSVTVRSGTRDLDRMGGLLSRLPATGALFLVGGLGAAAVPPLNGFASELLLFLTAYKGATGYRPDTLAAAAMFLAVVGIAVTGALAVAAFLKAFGFIFLGTPRGAGAASSAPERKDILLPHLLLASAAVAVAALSPRVVVLILPTAETLALRTLAGGRPDIGGMATAGALETLASINAGCWLVSGCLLLALCIRWLLVRDKRRASGPTWDCGFAAPDPRMQYTATSFAEPLAENFHLIANREEEEHPPKGIFPAGASYHSHIPGVERTWGLRHLFIFVGRVAARVRVLQTGRVQMYLLYMALILVVLLLWKL